MNKDFENLSGINLVLELGIILIERIFIIIGSFSDFVYVAKKHFQVLEFLYDNISAAFIVIEILYSYNIFT